MIKGHEELPQDQATLEMDKQFHSIAMENHYFNMTTDKLLQIRFRSIIRANVYTEGAF